MKTVYEIGELRLDPETRVLTRDGEPVALGARAVAVLAALVRRAGEPVSKAEIIDSAWPGLVVEEANLAVQISAIRRALACVPGGESWIETLARRGYRFVGPRTALAARPPGDAWPRVDRTRTNLPQVQTSFVGREREIADIKRLLPSTRVLTLTGTGGIGKTRLAVQAAAEVLDAYRDGAWFVDLAPLADPALVPGALAQVLGVKEDSGQALQQALCAYLRRKELLLVLDNCEHVLGAAADLVDAVVRDTARVAVIATSRESLRVAGERTYPLPVLPLPDPKAAATSIARSDAVQLFVDRARQIRPRFELDGPRARAVAEICVRLDGLPLALELAAARVAVLPVEEIVRMLDQRLRLLAGRGDLPRQQTLRAMLDWSYELLDAAERQLFARLSVFAGGWTVAAAQAVGAGEGIAGEDVVYLLIALIEKSLVAADEDGDRYRMLETVRAYAQEKLAHGGGAEAVRARHRDYFLALAEESSPKLSGSEQADVLQRLEVEHDNLRAAIEWSLAAADPTQALRLCGALQQFWWTRGHLTEGRKWCALCLAKAGAERRTPERASTLGAAGVLANFQGDTAHARSLHEEALAIRRELGDRLGVANSLSNLGSLALDRCDFAAAEALYEESIAIRRELGDRLGIAHALHDLGHVACDQGAYPVARKHYEDSLSIVRMLGDEVAASRALLSLGFVAKSQGDPAASRALLEECLAIKRKLGDRRGMAHALNNLGLGASDRGELALARELYEESLAIKRELGDRRGAANTLNNLGLIAMELGEPADARALIEESLVIRCELADHWGMAISLEGLAPVIATLGAPIRAAHVWGAAERLREENGTPRPPDQRAMYERAVTAARTAFADDAAFDQAWQEGRAMPLEQAIELAMKRSR